MRKALSPHPPAADGTGRRLTALRAAGLLDAPAEERFDRLTRLARHVLRAPVVLVSLLDADRQFFLSAQGLPEPWAGLRQTPLSHSFCRAVVETGLPMSVGDAREDARVRGNPAVEELGVVAYAAVPLALPDGCVVGALCGIDRRPRAWTAAEEGALRDLAGAVEAEMAATVRLREAEAAGAALREGEARYRALFEVSPQMVWFADAAGRCTHVNRYYTDFVGLPAERALGDGWLAAVHPEDRSCARGAWGGAVAGVEGYEVEYRVRRGSDGSHRWFLVRGAPLRGADGRVERWIGVGVDIDDRRRAEAALAESEARLHLALEAGRLAFWELDPATGAVLRAPFHDAIFGYEAPLPAWSYEAFLGHVLPEDRGAVERAYRAAVEGGSGETVECRIRRAGDGAVRWLEVHGRAQRDAGGRVLRLHGVLRDVTERKGTEEALRASEERFRRAVGIGTVGVLFFGLDGRMTDANAAFERMSGYTRGELVAIEDWMVLTPPEFMGVTLPAAAELAERGETAPYEKQMVRKDGSRWWGLFAPTRLSGAGRASRCVEFIVDVTERKRAEEALREARERLAAALAAGRMASWDWDPATGRITASDTIADLFGLLPGEAWRSGAEGFRLVHPDDVDRHRAVVGAAAREGGSWRSEFRIVRPRDGEVAWLEERAEAVRDPRTGKVTMAGLVWDVTERKRAEEALRESEERLRLIVEGARDYAIFTTDREDRIVDWAPGAAAAFGWSAAEAVGQPSAMLFTPEDRAAGVPEREVEAARREGVAPNVRWHVRKDGSRVFIEGSARALRGPGGGVRGFLKIGQDVTERRRAEEALRASEARLRELQAELLHVSRLSAAGEMAAALAHELNQPLTAAASAVQAARRTLASAPLEGPGGQPPEVREALDLAAEQARRAGQIVRRLRDFVARGEADPRLEDLPRLVEEAAALALVGARERGVAVALRIEPGLPQVLADRIQVQQVLFNLMRNALEAMGDGGAAASGGSRAGSPRYRELVVAADAADPGTVEVAVADTGPGLAPEVAGRLFEPFVSTKPDGMGVGLAICRTIVEAHGGRLWAEPNPGGGAVFRFTLPTAPPLEAGTRHPRTRGPSEKGRR